MSYLDKIPDFSLGFGFLGQCHGKKELDVRAREQRDFVFVQDFLFKHIVQSHDCQGDVVMPGPPCPHLIICRAKCVLAVLKPSFHPVPLHLSVQQGMVAMLGTFIDTIIICSITGLVIITSGVWTSGINGASLSAAAFAQALPGAGNYIVAVSLAIFAFTTLLGWSYYSERCTEFLFGVKAIMPFRVLWVIAIPLGATYNLKFAWLLADTLNALMAIPNLIALLLLSPVVFSLTREYIRKNN